MLLGNGSTTSGRRILAVDDDSTVQDILSFFLGDAYEVRLVTTAADAIVTLRREQVDLVVLDHRLPDRTGLELLPELKSICTHLPVVMLTAYGSEWICAAAFKLGVADYLQKPMNALDLVRTVQRILSSSPEGRSPMLNTSNLKHARTVLMSIPIQKAMGLIQQRYWLPLSLSTLASQVGMSRYRLSHRFREVLGITCRDYLMRLRVERAKSLLAAGQLSISEVAQNVGFSDLARFDKIFKRSTGYTPSAYRSAALTPEQDVAK